MVILMKIIHFLAFAVVVGGGVTSGVVGARMARAEAAARETLAGIQAGIGKLSLISLALLWASGIGLTYRYYSGWASLPPSFWLKIIFVVILTGLSVRLSVQTSARKTGERLPRKSAALLGQMGVVTSFLVVIFATLAFTG